jgi:hypothetical protein
MAMILKVASLAEDPSQAFLLKHFYRIVSLVGPTNLLPLARKAATESAGNMRCRSLESTVVAS